MARRRVGETKRRLSFASASTPARVISTRPKRLEDQHIPRRPARSLLALLVLMPTVVVVVVLLLPLLA
jgi:hypothetical protein